MNPKLAVMILACDRHAESVARILDNTGVDNWVIVPAVQARRLGFLQNVPRRRHGSTAIFGFAEQSVAGHALQTLAQAEHNRTLCPDCVVFVWEAKQLLTANVSLDPVCEEVVDRENALSATYDGTKYYFCSAHCLEAFNMRPTAYTERAQLADRVGRREVVAPKPASRKVVRTRVKSPVRPRR